MAADRRRPAAARPGRARRPRTRCARRPRSRRTADAGPRRRGPHPGHAAPAGPRRSSATTRRGCTSRPRASSRPPGCPVAAHRAARLTAASTRTVIDLGCGIGGDLLATARAGIIGAGVDLDPVRVAVAEANLAALGLAGAVMVADATEVDTGPVRRRLRRPRPPDRPGPHLRRRRLDPAVAVRRGPAAPRLLRQGGARHPARPGPRRASRPSGSATTARSRRPRSGRAGSPRPGRRATVIGDGGLATLTEEDDPGAGRRAGRPLPLRARRRGDPRRPGHRGRRRRARRPGRRRTSPTSPPTCRSDTPFARGYEVLEELPYREKALRAALRERGVGTLTIKKRGVDVVPDQLRKRLALTGDNEATIVLTRVAGHGTALLVRPF